LEALDLCHSSVHENRFPYHQWYKNLDQLSKESPIYDPKFLEHVNLMTHLDEEAQQELYDDLSTLNEGDPDEEAIGGNFTLRFEEEKKHVAKKNGTVSRMLLNYAYRFDWVTIKHMFRRLKWLGIPDPRISDYVYPDNLLEQLRLHCSSLETLSVRGEYKADSTDRNPSEAHSHICQFLYPIVSCIPESVVNLELRLSIDFFQFLLKALLEKTNIRHVGIDLGAWVQIYPLIEEQPSIDHAVKQKAAVTAIQLRHEIYEKAHKEVLPVGSKWHLPDAVDGEGGSRSTLNMFPENQNYYDRSGVEVYPVEVYSPSSRDSQSPDGPDELPFLTRERCLHILDCTQADTLPKMFKKLHKAGTETQDMELFALEPEGKSTNPIHPLALIQARSETFLKDNGLGTDYENFSPRNLDEIYPWLEATFKWTPVFDWDW
jgi:hypothetical protein